MNLASRQPVCEPGASARDRRAFTLIEMVLAIAIAGIILVAINTVFFGALKLRAGSIAATEKVQPVDRALAILKRDLLGIAPPGDMIGVMGTDATSVGFSEPVIVEFYTTTGVVSDDLPFGDIQKIDYFLRNPTNTANSSGKDLIRGVSRNLLATVTETPEPKLLLSDVSSLRFSYFDGTNWMDSWNISLSNTPVAMKGFLEFAQPKSGGAPNPPVQFLVPIRIQSTNQTTATNQVTY